MNVVDEGGFGVPKFNSIQNKKILNIAAGFLPLVGSDFGPSVKVYNYDPLATSCKDKDFELRENLKAKFSDLIMGLRKIDNVKYYFEEEEVKREVKKDSIDILICVSPYGFTLVTQWVHERLKIGAYIIIIGNKANKYITHGENIFEPPLQQCYCKVLWPFDTFAMDVATKLLKKYPSNVSGLGRKTTLDLASVFLKTTLR